MTQPIVRTAAALVIGNEILSGKIQEANVQVLACELREMGIELRRVVVVPDEIETIAAETTALRTAHDVMFTSGGVGPTHDDVTILGIARSFGVGVVRAPEMERLLREFYGERCSDAHLRMADVPEGSDLVSFEGMKWPTIVMRNVWIFPGVPQIFRIKLPAIRRLRGGAPFRSRAVFVLLDEGDIAPLLEEVVAEFPAVSIGSYPQWSDPGHRVKLTFDAIDAELVDRALERFVSKLPEGALVRSE